MFGKGDILRGDPGPTKRCKSLSGRPDGVFGRDNRNRFQTLPVAFAYYEPREGGAQVYFGVGIVKAFVEDTEKSGHYYAGIHKYQPFRKEVSYYDGPNGEAWEASRAMRNSVRPITDDQLAAICAAGGVEMPTMDAGQAPIDHVRKLQQDLAEIQGLAGSMSPPKLPKMRYWITTQWPSPATPPRKHRNIFLPDGREAPGKRIKVGDLVMIYEAKTGRSEVVLDESGERTIKAKSNGRQGIVTVGEIVAPVKASRSPTSKYADGSEIWWRWKAETGNHNDCGFVPRSEVCRVLGLSPNYTFRGFGETHSGLKEIGPEQFNELASLFTAERPEPKSFRQRDHVPPKYGPGGEGAEHKALKLYVAAHPEIVFNEQGLEYVGTEVVTPSGDRIDVLLRDRIGRYVAVEIEVAQGQDQLDGLCQAVKYRFLACVLYGVDFEASRSALVAYDIHQSLEPVAGRYHVEIVRAERDAVSRS